MDKLEELAMKVFVENIEKDKKIAELLHKIDENERKIRDFEQLKAKMIEFLTEFNQKTYMDVVNMLGMEYNKPFYFINSLIQLYMALDGYLKADDLSKVLMPLMRAFDESRRLLDDWGKSL